MTASHETTQTTQNEKTERLVLGSWKNYLSEHFVTGINVKVAMSKQML